MQEGEIDTEKVPLNHIFSYFDIMNAAPQPHVEKYITTDGIRFDKKDIARKYACFDIIGSLDWIGEWHTKCTLCFFIIFLQPFIFFHFRTTTDVLSIRPSCAILSDMSKNLNNLTL